MSSPDSPHGEINFDSLAPIEVPVNIGGKKYILREASEDAAVKYRNAVLKSTKLGPDGKPSSIDGMADAEPLLVSLCLFEQYQHNGTMKDRPVLLTTVRSWPSRIVKVLFQKAKDISDLAETKDEDKDKEDTEGEEEEQEEGQEEQDESQIETGEYRVKN